MFRKLLISILPLAAFVLLTGEQMSDNGRAGKTGSPGELTCIDCHNDFTLNSGGGSILIQSPGMTNNKYAPGQTYTMSVTVSRATNNLFGVGIEALTTSNNNAGTLNITDAVSTQIKSATVSGISRRNIVHQLNGGASTNSKVFNFSWTAPAIGTGNVTFYFAGIAADADGNEEGDYVYASSQLFTEETCVSAPGQPSAINGNTTTCNGTNLTYSIPSVSGATSYTWTLPNGWTGTSTDTFINVTSGSSSGSVTVTAVNLCGGSIPSSLPVTSGSVSGMTNATNITCNGANNGSVNVNPSGGNAPYLYSWSPSGGSSSTITNLSAGNYTVTITDAIGCTASSTASVTEPAILFASAGNNQSICEGETANIGGSPSGSGGTTAYVYSWLPSAFLNSASDANPVANPLTTTTYSLTITDANNCSASSAVTITVNPLPVPVISNTGNTLHATNGFYHQWYLDGIPVTGANQPDFIALQSGNYTVEVTDNNGCTGISADYFYSPVGINNLNADREIKIIFNQAKNELSVSSYQENHTFNIFIIDGSGRIIKELLLNSGDNIFYIDKLASGLYTVVVTSGSEKYTKRFIICG